MKREIQISYNWWNSEKTEISPKHVKQLEQYAINTILEMIGKGYIGGELTTWLQPDKTTADLVFYRGSWNAVC